MAEQKVGVNEGSYENPYKFNGKELDVETGYYYYGARYYDPRISTFLSVDPLAEKTGTPYAYCYNNPINLINPTGMEPEGVDPPKTWAGKTIEKIVNWLGFGKKNKALTTNEKPKVKGVGTAGVMIGEDWGYHNDKNFSSLMGLPPGVYEEGNSLSSGVDNLYKNTPYFIKKLIPDVITISVEGNAVAHGGGGYAINYHILLAGNERGSIYTSTTESIHLGDGFDLSATFKLSASYFTENEDFFNPEFLSGKSDAFSGGAGFIGDLSAGISITRLKDSESKDRLITLFGSAGLGFEFSEVSGVNLMYSEETTSDV